MTRQYAAIRLLELGPLGFPEFVSITGWRASVARSVIAHLVAEGMVWGRRVPGQRLSIGKVIYGVAP